jgi:hypothetical protein
MNRIPLIGQIPFAATRIMIASSPAMIAHRAAMRQTVRRLCAITPVAILLSIRMYQIFSH